MLRDYLSFGAAVRLGLLPHTASRRQPRCLTTATTACSCLWLAVATISPREGLSPPIQCPCQAHTVGLRPSFAILAAAYSHPDCRAILILIVAPHVVDSQSVKAPEAKTRGYDAGKKIVGRKRHIAVDTDGRLLMVNLTPADISDSAGAQMILDGVRKRWPWPKHLFADGAYDRTQLMDEAAFRDFTIQIIKRSDAAMGFEVIPRRWVVERTFAWMTRWRRLVRDYEERIDCSEAMIHVALGSVLLRRIAHE